jgi:hypothetical protein
VMFRHRKVMFRHRKVMIHHQKAMFRHRKAIFVIEEPLSSGYERILTLAYILTGSEILNAN